MKAEAIECRHSTRGIDSKCSNHAVFVCATDARLRCGHHQARHVERNASCDGHFTTLDKLIEIKSQVKSKLSALGVDKRVCNLITYYKQMQNHTCHAWPCSSHKENTSLKPVEGSLTIAVRQILRHPAKEAHHPL